ncbi:MAG: 5-deoxy-glucuronate isomerase [bacterium]|nr:5-deoxy-glucuronate isomerase [bacterium]
MRSEEYLYQYHERYGYTSIVNPKSSKLNIIEFGILRLGSKEKYQDKAKNSELVLVVLSGICKVESDGEILNPVGYRKDVFSGLPYAVYIPQNTTYTVTGERDVEIAVCKGEVHSPQSTIHSPQLITPNQVKCRTVGRENFKREVRDIVGEDFPARVLLVGETLSPPGNWSSFPPHKHDENNLPQEACLEELYYFKVTPKQGFGIQGIYTSTKKVDNTFYVHDSSVVIIPEGYHPVVAAPGYSLYYLWVLAGNTRFLKFSEDPVHSWIK